MIHVKELAERLDVSAETIYRWAKLGRLPQSANGPGKPLCWEPEAIEAFITAYDDQRRATQEAASYMRELEAAITETRDAVQTIDKQVMRLDGNSKRQSKQLVEHGKALLELERRTALLGTHAAAWGQFAAAIIDAVKNNGIDVSAVVPTTPRFRDFASN